MRTGSDTVQFLMPVAAVMQVAWNVASQCSSPHEAVKRLGEGQIEAAIVDKQVEQIQGQDCVVDYMKVPSPVPDVRIVIRRKRGFSTPTEWDLIAQVFEEEWSPWILVAN